jgi:hypothetical protein
MGDVLGHPQGRRFNRHPCSQTVCSICTPLRKTSQGSAYCADPPHRGEGSSRHGSNPLILNGTKWCQSQHIIVRVQYAGSDLIPSSLLRAPPGDSAPPWSAFGTAHVAIRGSTAELQQNQSSRHGGAPLTRIATAARGVFHQPSSVAKDVGSTDTLSVEGILRFDDAGRLSGALGVRSL